MNPEQLQDAIGILTVALISTGLLLPKTKSKTAIKEPTASIKEISQILTGASAIREAKYPEADTVSPVYREEVPGFFDSYFKKTIPVFLSTDKNENIIYSPLNTYMAFDMLAETTEQSYFLQTANTPDNRRYILCFHLSMRSEAIVHLSVPKFDVTSKIDLKNDLQTLGVTHIFDSTKSNFSSLSESSKNIAISNIDQRSRVAIDELGCTASSYTFIQYFGSSLIPDKEVDFVLDRPFIFVVTSKLGLPVFVGILNQLG